MVDEHQSIRSINAYSPSRPQNIPLYGCQSIRMGSSSGNDESILSWSLVGRPIPAPDQHVGNNGHSFRTDKSLKIYSPFLCHDFYRQHNSGLIYQQAMRNKSPNLCVEVWKILQWCLKYHIVVRIHIVDSYPRQIECFGRQVIENRQIVKTEWALDQLIANTIFQMFN